MSDIDIENLKQHLKPNAIISPAELAALFGSHSEIDALVDQFDSDCGLFSYLVTRGLSEHLAALLEKGLHKNSEIFDIRTMMAHILAYDMPDILKLMERHDLPTDIANIDFNYFPRSIEVAVYYVAPKCLDYLLSKEAEDAYTPPFEQNYPIGWLSSMVGNGDQLFDLLQVLDKHARRFGIDLGTYQNIDFSTLDDVMRNCTDDEALMGYESFKREKLAENLGDVSLSDPGSRSLKPRI